MKRSKELLSVPVVSIEEGEEIASIKELIVSKDEKVLEFVLIEKYETNQDGMWVIPFKEIVGIGEVALTIQDTNSIINLEKLRMGDELLKNKAELIGEKIITKKGNLKGEVTEYLIDEETGQVTTYYYTTPEDPRERKLDISGVVTIGPSLIIVEDDIEDIIVEPELAQRYKEVVTTIPDKIETVDEPLDYKTSLEKEIEEEFENRYKKAKTELKQDTYKPVIRTPEEQAKLQRKEVEEEEEKEEPVAQEEQVEVKEEKDPIEDFMAQQEAKLVGKRLKQDLEDKDGNIIMYKNTEITKDMFEDIKKLGREMVMEVLMVV